MAGHEIKRNKMIERDKKRWKNREKNIYIFCLITGEWENRKSKEDGWMVCRCCLSFHSQLVITNNVSHPILLPLPLFWLISLSFYHSSNDIFSSSLIHMTLAKGSSLLAHTLAYTWITLYNFICVHLFVHHFYYPLYTLSHFQWYVVYISSENSRVHYPIFQPQPSMNFHVFEWPFQLTTIGTCTDNQTPTLNLYISTQYFFYFFVFYSWINSIVF